MSRTYKDKPSKVKFPEVYPYGVHVEKTKKRKKQDTEWHWISTPSWWTRLLMNRPQRRAVHLWERKALFSDLEELVQPSKKVAHIYYW